MKLQEGQVNALEQFGAEMGAEFRDKSISPHDIAEVARRRTPLFLRRQGISGNHDDRQELKDFVQKSALETAFTPAIEIQG